MTDPEMPRLPALPRSWDDVPTPERPIQTGPRLRDVARDLGPLRPGTAASAGAMVGMMQVFRAAAEAEQRAVRKALLEQVPEAAGDRCVQSLLAAPYVEGQPSTLREDLEAAIEAVSDAPYQPVTRYRSPCDIDPVIRHPQGCCFAETPGCPCPDADGGCLCPSRMDLNGLRSAHG